jgi:hypothetical protein
MCFIFPITPKQRNVCDMKLIKMRRRRRRRRRI